MAELHLFLCLLPVVVARSSSGGVAIRYTHHNIWNSLPNHVVDVIIVNLFKSRSDRFWVNQDVISRPT